MTLVIEGVPAEVSRDQACDLLRRLGLDPEHVISLRMEQHAIIAEVYATDPSGGRVKNAAGDGAAKHQVVIRIT